MKRFIYILSTLIICFSFSCNQSSSTNSEDKLNVEQVKQTKVKFEKTVHDFGDIEYAGDGSCEFKFKNTGSEKLVLSNVSTSCGCTVPEWPREPIAPGKESVIKVKYNTNRQGKFEKSITIRSNAKESPIKLIIKGVVGPKPIEENSADL